MNPLDFSGPQFLGFYGILIVAAVVTILLLHRTLRPSEGAGSRRSQDLSAFELAYLAKGDNRAVQTALVSLGSRGAIAPGAKGTLVANSLNGIAIDPLERAVYAAVRSFGDRPTHLARRCRDTLQAMEDRLVGAGLLVAGRRGAPLDGCRRP